MKETKARKESTTEERNNQKTIKDSKIYMRFKWIREIEYLSSTTQLALQAATSCKITCLMGKPAVILTSMLT